jgi:hypothetical protein
MTHLKPLVEPVPPRRNKSFDTVARNKVPSETINAVGHTQARIVAF